MSVVSKFCFPARTLSNELVKLTPFISSIHTPTYYALSSGHPEIYAHMGPGPYSTEDEFVTQFIEGIVDLDPKMMTFAIIDKTSSSTKEDDEGALAGMVSYINSSTANKITEIGFLVILPPFRRTHVTTNVVGLMLQYALDSPDEGGLGLHKVQWQTSSMNAASVRVAERMGFQKEGLLKWDRLFKGGAGKWKVGNGRKLPEGSGKGDLARDTVLFSLCWDDWQEGARKKVNASMILRRK